MSFDLSTSKPVEDSNSTPDTKEKKPSFDLKTAKVIPEPPKPKEEPESVISEDPEVAFSNASAGAGEVVAHAATSAVSPITGVIAGEARALTGSLPKEGTPGRDEAKKKLYDEGKASVVYEPKSESGKQIMSAVSDATKPFKERISALFDPIKPTLNKIGESIPGSPLQKELVLDLAGAYLTVGGPTGVGKIAGKVSEKVSQKIAESPIGKRIAERELAKKEAQDTFIKKTTESAAKHADTYQAAKDSSGVRLQEADLIAHQLNEQKDNISISSGTIGNQVKNAIVSRMSKSQYQRYLIDRARGINKLKSALVKTDPKLAETITTDAYGNVESFNSKKTVTAIEESLKNPQLTPEVKTKLEQLKTTAQAIGESGVRSSRTKALGNSLIEKIVSGIKSPSAVTTIGVLEVVAGLKTAGVSTLVFGAAKGTISHLSGDDAVISLSKELSKKVKDATSKGSSGRGKDFVGEQPKKTDLPKEFDTATPEQQKGMIERSETVQKLNSKEKAEALQKKVSAGEFDKQPKSKTEDIFPTKKDKVNLENTVKKNTQEITAADTKKRVEQAKKKLEELEKNRKDGLSRLSDDLKQDKKDAQNAYAEKKLKELKEKFGKKDITADSVKNEKKTKSEMLSFLMDKHGLTRSEAEQALGIDGTTNDSKPKLTYGGTASISDKKSTLIKNPIPRGKKDPSHSMIKKLYEAHANKDYTEANIPVDKIQTYQATIDTKSKRVVELKSTPVVYKEGDKYSIYDGNHRVAAALKKGEKNIKVRILNVKDEE